MADLFSQDPVHGFESRDAFANHGERFGAIAATGVVDQETGHVGGADHAVAGLANQCRQSLADDLVGPGTGAGPVETTRFTAEPVVTPTPAAGFWLLTRPAGTVALNC